ncbi:MAG: Uma2 family endonuclease [Flaviaesturariibacter sp.]|nr:Uma2 family endonuclease [Flaviaesturariibacter sp.]
MEQASKTILILKGMDFQLTLQDIPHYSHSDYKKWEGDWELIRGIPYAMSPAPHWKHQSFGSDFIFYIRQALAQKTTCSCTVLYESDWVVNDDTVVRPDVMIVCESIQGEHVSKPPVLILEILYPSSLLKDRNTKFNLYQAYGVKYYLIANLEKKELEIFHLKDNRYQELGPSEPIFLTERCSIELNKQTLLSGIA